MSGLTNTPLVEVRFTWPSGFSEEFSLPEKDARKALDELEKTHGEPRVPADHFVRRAQARAGGRIAVKLSVARDLMGLALDDVAQKTGISRETIEHYESGRSKPCLEDALKLSKLYRCRLCECFDG